MSSLNWQVDISTVCGKMSYSGTKPLEDENIKVFLDLPDSTILSITADVDIDLQQDERVFINGFQSWTHCPEVGKHDIVPPGSKLPSIINKAFSIERYGDYYFTKHNSEPGISHGESYCYFRKDNTYRLLASCDETLGYTVFNYDANTKKLHIERDCVGLHVIGGIRILDLFWKTGTEKNVFDAWFSAMDIQPRTAATQKLSGYSSWYNRYEKISEKTIMEDLEGCKKVLKPGDLFQIDDGWEAHVGDWLLPDSKKFRSDMGKTVKKIHDSGFKAGLWLAPFAAEIKSDIFKKHPDWVLKGPDEKPWLCGSNWGGFYSLNIDNPDVVIYLKSVFDTVFDTWGFDLVKLDFLYGVAPFCSADETRAARMIRAMKLLRTLCGDKLILSCGVPLMPAFGIVDYCRIGPDVGLSWNENFIMKLTNREHVSTAHSVENTIFRRELNGRAFGNDPDVFFLRSENIRMSNEEKLKLSRINALFGNILLTSDNPSNYSKNALKKYKYIRELFASTDTDATIQYLPTENKVEVSFYEPDDTKRKTKTSIKI